MDDYTLIEEGNTVQVRGKTFPIKDQLKDKGARWNAKDKVWFFENTKLPEAELLMKSLKRKPALDIKLVDEPMPKQQKTVRKSPRKPGGVSPEIKEPPTYKQIEKSLVEAKNRWSEMVKKDGITTQNVNLKNASIKMQYVGFGERSPKYHTVIKYVDSKLTSYAEKVTQFLESKGCDLYRGKHCK